MFEASYWDDVHLRWCRTSHLFFLVFAFFWGGHRGQPDQLPPTTLPVKAKPSCSFDDAAQSTQKVGNIKDEIILQNTYSGAHKPRRRGFFGEVAFLKPSDPTPNQKNNERYERLVSEGNFTKSFILSQIPKIGNPLCCVDKQLAPFFVNWQLKWFPTNKWSTRTNMAMENPHPFLANPCLVTHSGESGREAEVFWNSPTLLKTYYWNWNRRHFVDICIYIYYIYIWSIYVCIYIYIYIYDLSMYM